MQANYNDKPKKGKQMHVILSGFNSMLLHRRRCRCKHEHAQMNIKDEQLYINIGIGQNFIS